MGGFYAVGTGVELGLCILRRCEGVWRGEVVVGEGHWGCGMGMVMGMFVVWMAVGEGR